MEETDFGEIYDPPEVNDPVEGSLAEWLTQRKVEILTKFDERANGGNPTLSVPSGLHKLDAAGYGDLGVLHLFFALPGDGKSALALQLAESAAKRGHGVVLCMLEDLAEATADRLIAKQLPTGVSTVDWRRLSKKITRDTILGIDVEPWMAFVQAIDYKFTASQALAFIEERMNDNTKLVIVDYATSVQRDKAENLEAAMSKLALDLSLLAKTKRVVVVLFAQASLKTVAERGKKYLNNYQFQHKCQDVTYEAIEGFRPGVADVAWSGALVQYAKFVSTFFRPGRWIRENGGTADDDTIEFSVNKCNNGTTDATPIIFAWDGPKTTIG